MTNREVAKAWASGRAAHALNFRTDGNSLWSYALKIGETSTGGGKIVLDYRRAISVTTSRHLGLALPFADDVVEPPESES